MGPFTSLMQWYWRLAPSTLAQWCGAVGTIAAVIVALFKDRIIARRRRPQLVATCTKEIPWRSFLWTTPRIPPTIRPSVPTANMTRMPPDQRDSTPPSAIPATTPVKTNFRIFFATGLSPLDNDKAANE